MTICDLIANNKSLTKLFLRGSLIRSDDLIAISKVLSTNSTLTEIDVSDTLARAEAIQAFIVVVKTHPSLLHLRFGGNSIGEMHVEVADMLRKNKLLSSIYLDRTKDLSRAGKKSLLYALAVDSPALKVFSMNDVPLDVELVPEIAKSLQRNTHIEELHWRRNGVFSKTTPQETIDQLLTLFCTSPSLVLLGIDIPDMTGRLLTKHLEGRGLQEFPASLCKLSCLQILNLANNQLATIPASISNLVELRELDISSNRLLTLPPAMGFLHNLKVLKLANNQFKTPPPEVISKNNTKLTLGYLRDLAKGAEPVYRIKLMMVGQENVGKTTILRHIKRRRMRRAAKKGPIKPTISTDGIDVDEWFLEVPFDDDPPVTTNTTTSISATALIAGSGSIGAASAPPGGSVSSGTAGSGSFSSSGAHGAHSGSVGASASPSSTGSVGSTGSASSSGQRQLTRGTSMMNTRVTSSPASGESSGRNVTVSSWDFAGQEIYYTTHQFFLSQRALYVLVWDLRFDDEECKVSYWLQSIRSRTNNSPVIIVGTHADEFGSPDEAVAKAEKVRKKFQKRFPFIKYSLAVSAKNESDINNLVAKIRDTVRVQDHMGELIPKTYIELERLVREESQAVKEGKAPYPPMRSWAQIQQLASYCHINDDDELRRCVHLLHDFGSLIYFDDPSLGVQDLVIIDPQFLTNVMATIITTKTSIRDGIMPHNFIPMIWRPPEFPLEIHELLLSLLKKFEIAYTLPPALRAKFGYRGHKMPSIPLGYNTPPASPLPSTAAPPPPTHLPPPPQVANAGLLDEPPSRKSAPVPLLDEPQNRKSAPLLTPQDALVAQLQAYHARQASKPNQSPPQSQTHHHQDSNGDTPPKRTSMPDTLPLGGMAPSSNVPGHRTSAPESLSPFEHAAGPTLAVPPTFGGPVPSSGATTPSPRNSGSSPLLPPSTLLNPTLAPLQQQGNTSQSSSTSLLPPPALFALPISNLLPTANPLVSSTSSGLSTGSFSSGASPATSGLGGTVSLDSSTSSVPSSPHLNTNPLLPSATPLLSASSMGGSSLPSANPLLAPSNPGLPPAVALNHPMLISTPLNMAQLSASSLSNTLTAPLTPTTNHSAEATNPAASSAPPQQPQTQPQISAPQPSTQTSPQLTQASAQPPSVRVSDDDAQTLIPSLLPEDRPDLELLWRPYDAGKTQFDRRYQLEFVPKGLFSRLMIRVLHHVDGVMSYWRNGLVAETGKDIFLMELRPNEAVLMVSVRGPRSTPPVETFRMCVETIDVLIGLNNWFNIKVTKQVPCPHCIELLKEDAQVWQFPLALLEEKAAAGKWVVECEANPNDHKQMHLTRLVPDMALTDLERSKIPYEELEIGDEIGKGAFGIIHKARYNTQEVAVKVMKNAEHEDVKQKAFSEFRREAHVMSGMRHPNLVNMLGFCVNPFALVMELLPEGNLYKFLAARAQQDIGWPLRIKLALDVALGLHYLHSATPPFIHRDIKSPNVLLLSTNYLSEVCAKIGDFGLSSRMYVPSLQEKAVSRDVANPTWLAPEIIREQEFNVASDVYSYGIILWELLTRKHPYSEYPYQFMFELEDIIKRGMRPTIPADAPADYAALIRRCSADDPEERPTMFEVIKLLISMAADLAPELHIPEDIFSKLTTTVANSSNPNDADLPRSGSAADLRLPETTLNGHFLKQLSTQPMNKIYSMTPVGENQMWCGTREGHVLIWNTKNGQLLARHENLHKSAITSIFVAGYYIWTHAWGEKARVWKTMDEASLSTLAEKKGAALEGYLTHKTSGLTKKLKRRWFSIQAKRLYMYKEEGDKVPVSIIELDGAKVTSDPKAKAPTFSVQPKNQREKATVIQAKDRQELLDWMAALEVEISSADRRFEISHVTDIDCADMRCFIVMDGLVWGGSMDMRLKAWDPDRFQLLKNIVVDLANALPPGESSSSLFINYITEYDNRLWLGVQKYLICLDKASLLVIRALSQHAHTINGVVGYDGRIWTCADDATIRVWDAFSYECLQSFTDTGGKQFAMMRVGLQIWAAGWDGIIRVYNGKTAQLTRALELKHQDAISTFAPSYDSVWAGSWDGTVSIWS